MNIRSSLLHVIPVVLIVAAHTASGSEHNREVPARPGETCTVCNGPLTGGDIALIVKGRRVPIDTLHIDEFLKNQDKYFASLQPRGALFAEAPEAKEGTALGGVSGGWFIVGMYVLVGLVFGGLSGYAAVSKGLPPILNFIIGFSVPLLGYLYVVTRTGKARPGEIPAGLVKVPATSAPVYCEKCGFSNHPSAKVCSACHTPLRPERESEVVRAS